MQKYVLTGPAHSGKTELLNRLNSRRDYTTVQEAETPYIQRLKSRYGAERTGELILGDYFRFKSAVGRRQAKIDTALDSMSSETVILDRCGIDWIAYCKMRGVAVPNIILEAAGRHSYEGVFFLEMLPVFDERRNEGRVMDKGQSLRLRDLIMDEYVRRGYNPILLPVFDENKEENIAARVGIIENTITNNTSL